MKLISVMIAAFTVAFHPVGSIANPVPPAREKTITVSDVYIPENLNSKSESYIEVSGRFANTCYHWSHARVDSPTPLLQQVEAIALVDQTLCLMVIVPFEEPISLGVLQPGVHTLRFINSNGTYAEHSFTVN